MNDMFDVRKSVLEELNSDFLSSAGVRLFIKRDDLIDDEVSGNKWRKLKYNVVKCRHERKKGILTFGGAYSNHLAATAAACKRAGLNSIGIVRGDELNKESNLTLKRCAENGMKLIFISRNDYALRSDRAFLEELRVDNPEYYTVPEGGANYYGMIGCQELLREIEIEFSHIIVAQGTTTTSCGIAMGLQGNQKLIAVPVLKGFDAVGEMKRLYTQSAIEKSAIDEMISRVAVLDDYHFGGYGKYTDDLLEFIREFYNKYQIKLDPVYTGKAMFALFDAIKNGTLINTSIIFVHTGGLQGIKGVEQQSGRKLFDS